MTRRRRDYGAMQAAWEADDAEQAARRAYVEAVDRAWGRLVTRVQAAYAAYDAAVQPARDAYDAKRNAPVVVPPDAGQVRERLVDGLRFLLTCSSCPEQYDVYSGEMQVGYVRLRHSEFTVEFPEPGRTLILYVRYREGADAGEFDDVDRVRHLRMAAAAIHAKLQFIAQGVSS